MMGLGALVGRSPGGMLNALFLVDFQPTANSLRVSRLYAVIRYLFSCLSLTAARPCIHAAAGAPPHCCVPPGVMASPVH
jgi:hypothetical protein